MAKILARFYSTSKIAIKVFIIPYSVSKLFKKMLYLIIKMLFHINKLQKNSGEENLYVNINCNQGRN